jgi:hypothetical protein
MVCVFLLAAAPALTVSGQDGGEPLVNCHGLSDADCQILQDSMTAMQGVTSFSMPAWAVDLYLNAGEESIKVITNGHGAAQLPPSMMAWGSDAQGLLDNYTDLDALIAFYEQLNSALILQWLEEAGLYMAVEYAEIQSPDQNGSGSADLIYKDEGLYVRLEAPTGAEAWFGEVLEPTEADVAELDQSIADLLAQMQTEEFQEAWAQMSELTGTSERLMTLINKYILTTRGEDAEMMGQTMLVFTTTFDARGLLSDPDLPVLLMEVLKNPALAELELDTEGLEDLNETQLQFILMTANFVLQDVVVSAEQWIGADDLYIHKIAVEAGLKVDTSLFAEDIDAQVVEGHAMFSVEMADFNTDVMADVQPPADYFDLDDTEGFLMGSADMIEQELALGQSFAASFDDTDQQDIYSLTLEAGQSVKIELTSEDYPYLNLYGPDGFLISEFDTYYEKSLDFTAETAGMYLVVIEGYWELDYEITIRAQ